MHSIDKGPTGPCQNLRTSKLFKLFLGMKERMSEGKRERVCECVVLYVQARTHSRMGGICPTVKYPHTTGEEKILRGHCLAWGHTHSRICYF